MTFTQAQLNQLAASGNGADVLAALRKYTYVEIGGQKLLIDQILPVMKNGGYWGSQDFDTVLITLKTPYVGISASTNGHVSLNVVLGGGSGEYGGENYADKVKAARRGAGQRNAGHEPAGWRQRHHERGHRGDQRLQHRPSLGQDPDRRVRCTTC